MPPALRARFFSSHLREFGWEPTVITTDPKYYEWAIDRANEQLLPPNLRVLRTNAVSARFTRGIGFGDLGIRSLWHHWKAVSELHRSNPIDAIFISVPPFVPMILGRLAHWRYGIPYVIDYIDPWRSDYMRQLPKGQRPSKWRLAEAMAQTLEPIAIRRASHIVGVSQGTTDLVIANYPYLSRANTTEIPYGAPIYDFEYLLTHSRDNLIFDKNDGLIHLSYTGALISPMYTTLRALFAAFREGLLRSPDVFYKVRLHFVGTTYASNQPDLYQALPLANDFDIANFVTEQPKRVSYLDANQILLDSHGLLMIGSDAAHYTASKVFPYILSRKPVLALFHAQSSVIRILEETQSGRFVSFSMENTLSDQIEAIYQELLTLISYPTHWHPPTRWEVFEQYTARAMAERLAKVLDQVVAHE